GMGRHRELAWLSMVECVLVIALGSTVARPFGLIGVGVVFAAGAALCRGTGQLIYACRVVGIPVFSYLRHSVLPSMAAATLPGVGLWASAMLLTPRTWERTLACLAVYGAFWAVSGVLLSWPRLARVFATMAKEAP